MSDPRRTYLALTGGVGGAKLGLGLARRLGPDALAFLVNTGDDFEHLGLHVSPDLDTLMYTLAGLANPETGWGRVGESWQFIESFERLGGAGWFKLGDRDLAVHVRRTQRLREGVPLSAVTRALNAALGVRHPIFPMSDAPVPTRVLTPAGPLMFQHYFVRERCAPAVTGFEFHGAAAARLVPEAAAWIADPALAGVVLCPSNPYVSIDPILAVPGLREGLAAAAAPIVAVSPIVAGLAIKGPTAKMMAELGVPNTALAVAAHYRDLLDGFIVDERDAALVGAIEALGIAAIAAPTVMVTLEDRTRLADITIRFIEDLERSR